MAGDRSLSVSLENSKLALLFKWFCSAFFMEKNGR